MNEEKTLVLEVGTILVCQWGYSMTLVDFYKVLSETTKTALVQKIGSIEKGEGFLHGTSTPDETKITNEKLRLYKIRDEKNDGWYLKSRKTGYNKYFHKWDGQPVEFDHCD